MPETALICRIPEIEAHIARYRERYDPSARRNVPAHVTVLYPFMPPAEVDEDVLARLRDIVRAVPCFSYRLARTRRFPVALYIEPEPDVHFSALTDGIWSAYPDYPPFAGKFSTVVPHVTVAHGDEELLCSIEIELRIALAGGVAARCSEVLLIENSTGRWATMHTLPLGS